MHTIGRAVGCCVSHPERPHCTLSGGFSYSSKRVLVLHPVLLGKLAGGHRVSRSPSSAVFFLVSTHNFSTSTLWSRSSLEFALVFVCFVQSVLERRWLAHRTMIIIMIQVEKYIPLPACRIANKLAGARWCACLSTPNERAQSCYFSGHVVVARSFSLQQRSKWPRDS